MQTIHLLQGRLGQDIRWHGLALWRDHGRFSFFHSGRFMGLIQIRYWKVYGQKHSNQSLQQQESQPRYNRDMKRMVWRKPRLCKRVSKSNQWNTFKAFQKACKKEFLKLKSTTSTMSYKIKTTLNTFDAMSNPDNKTILVSHR